ncbi:hypothetical protein MPTK2_1g10950 [Marchantia polymorpha subsp. ruderalis]
MIIGHRSICFCTFGLAFVVVHEASLPTCYTFARLGRSFSRHGATSSTVGHLLLSIIKLSMMTPNEA